MRADASRGRAIVRWRGLDTARIPEEAPEAVRMRKMRHYLLNAKIALTASVLIVCSSAWLFSFGRQVTLRRDLAEPAASSSAVLRKYSVTAARGQAVFEESIYILNNSPPRIRFRESSWVFNTQTATAPIDVVVPFVHPTIFRGVRIPIWPAPVTTAVVLGFLVFRAARPRGRSSQGRCQSCGYDLRATPDRCPECGAVPPRTSHRNDASARGAVT
jgi:hypothetical protein